MTFQPIDRENWKREEYYCHFTKVRPCTFSMTVRLDITTLQKAKYKLYPALLYLLTKTVNRHEAFRTALDENGVLGVFDCMNPSYTVFHPESETFSSLWTAWQEDFSAFLQSYEADLAQYGALLQLEPKPAMPPNLFPVSMLPWRSFDGFNLNLQKGYDYLLPIFTIGKYEEENGRCLLPIAIQVHHAVCDGFHLCRFLDELQEAIHAFSRQAER